MLRKVVDAAKPFAYSDTFSAIDHVILREAIDAAKEQK